ncbi:MAG: three-Cys-motif partner protein TcmP [Defluviitaleaceae bacterium]|nr:three-Cys-motif partner protein TcmP [Defluviitaleaceae bacterium]
MAKEQTFGGIWTIKKLDALEEYLKFFTNALKNKTFKFCYIDAFAGRGHTPLKDGTTIDGSAIRALKYDFDEYFFIEKKKEYCDELRRKLATSENFQNKKGKIVVINGDCNELLQTINRRNWYSENWRGVIFLDPFAMELDWASLEKISQTKAFDCWYLFPYSAANRILRNDGKIQDTTEDILNKLFGTSEWRTAMYAKLNQVQISLFGDESTEEKIHKALKTFIVERLRQVFPNVSSNPAELKNTTNSIMFLLCFAVSNPQKAAYDLALKGANHILTHMED